MRFVRKGGIWKNTEDEILKVAVMKYGKNQWARISSLLVRKSAKQCKARWYEWLDPSVKKTEWSREEEEKLLHLAKIMPSQWRSIATIVGRTSTQCLEHYGQLLDQAQALDHSESADAKSETVRRLRPGDIDAHPESKPARPDPIDMDEDEKEMLSEARARLANTKGKKAKRKAREKQLEEARRLATLQKRRELKAAGIEFKGPPRPSKNKNKRKEMDYNTEIPLERRVPRGFFDTSDEDQAMKKLRSAEVFIGKTLTELDGKRRDAIEEQERKKDAKRQELMKKHDLPSYIAQINKLNDPQLSRPRPTLSLPAPQITDKELRGLSSLGVLGDGTPVSRGLSQTYRGPSATPTPMRTPAPAIGTDSLVMEAQNLLALERSQTPLTGGENAYLHPSDFSAATPKHKSFHTPNTLAIAGGTTPSLPGATPSSQVQRTPRRDAFNINVVAGDEYESTPNLENHQSRIISEQLRGSFHSLPKANNEFALVIQDAVEDDTVSEAVDTIVPDADDVRRWDVEEKTKLWTIAFKSMSTVLQRPELPRPASFNADIPVSFSPNADFDIESEIHQEMLSKVQHDLTIHPSGRKPDPSDSGQPVFPYTLEQISIARDIVESEAGEFDELTEVSEIANASPAVVTQDMIPSLIDYLDNREKTIGKIEARLASHISGLHHQGKSLRIQLSQTHRDLEQSALDLDCFKMLADMEAVAIPDRIRLLSTEVEDVVNLEESLQQEYRSLDEQYSQLCKPTSVC